MDATARDTIARPGRQLLIGSIRRPAIARADELIEAQALAARTACEQMTAPAMKRLLDSVERASSLPARPGWERKAAAHAEFFRLLADVAGDQAPAGLTGQARLIRDLMRTVGPAVNGMITSSRQRLLARLRAGDADGAALEMEDHLRVLHYMCRLAALGAPALGPVIGGLLVTAASWRCCHPPAASGQPRVPGDECTDHQNLVMLAHQAGGEARYQTERRGR